MNQVAKTINNLTGLIEQRSYTTTGNLYSVSNAAGQKTVYAYDTYNQLIQTTNAMNQVETNEYNAKGQIISKTDKNGNITSYTYDKNGNQISVTDPRGNTTSTLYDAEGNVVQVTDALGNTKTSEYNAFGQTVKTVDQPNFLVEYVYNDKQQNIQINYPYGFHHKFAYDEAGRVIEEINSNGSSKLTTYDQLGNAITKTDGNGNTTTFVYDASNRIVKEEKPNGLIIETGYDEFGNLIEQLEDGIVVEQNEYNSYNQQITSINAMKQEKHITYDVLGRISKSIDFDGIETSFVYDELGQVLTQTQNNQIITTFTYDGSGNLLTQSINGILQKENSYDENNNVIEETKQGVTTQSTYDERNAVIEISLNGNQLYTYSYDVRGYRTEIKDKDGHVASQKFDYFGNVISSTDTLGNEIKYDYDGEKNLVKVEDPSGRVVNYKVDGNNNVIEKKVNDDKIATSVYDESNNLIEYTDENGFKETFAYDHQGNQIELIKPNGTVITTKYNELNQVTQITTGSDTITKEYDLRGNLVSTTNNQGTETRVVDDLNRITEVKDVKGNRTTYQLDSFGNQTEITYAEGTVITKEYNDFNQLITIERNHELEARYTYDVNGFVDKIVQGNGVVVELETDIYGRLLTKDTKSNGTLIEGFKFTYDSENNLLSEEITTPTENYTNTYTYDENNELKTSSKMRDGERVEVEYNYSVFGNRIQKSKSGDVSYNYNEKNQLTSMTSKEGETKYTYDTNGNVKSKMDAAGVVTTYTYDSFNRLVKVNQGKTETTYTYDGNGNRLTESVQDTTVIHDESTNTLYKNYTVNQLKGILARKENEDTFEAMREQVLIINKNKGCKVINKKLMQEAETQNTSSMTSYAPQITTFINDVTQEYNEVLVEKSPTQTRSYSYGVSRISDGTIYYQTSRNDSVTSITNQEGKGTESYNYSDYGMAESLGFGYNGERRDITGLIYLRNRTYDATSGKFLQLDTYLGEKDSIITQNRSIAFNNNPYKYIDRGGNRAAQPPKEGGYYKPPSNTPKSNPVPACKVEPKYDNAGNYAGLTGTYNGKDTNQLDLYGNEYGARVCPPNILDSLNNPYDSNYYKYAMNQKIDDELNKKIQQQLNDMLKYVDGMIGSVAEATASLSAFLGQVSIIFSDYAKSFSGDPYSGGIFAISAIVTGGFSAFFGLMSLGASYIQGYTGFTGTSLNGDKLSESEAEYRKQAAFRNGLVGIIGTVSGFRGTYGGVKVYNTLVDVYGKENVGNNNLVKGASGAGTKLEIPKYDASKLQHEFKHASDFGVNGNWNSANGEAFKNALNNHVSTSDTILQSTYRGSDVVVYINNATGNGAYYDLSGNFIGGWKFSAEQLQFHIKNGVSLK